MSNMVLRDASASKNVSMADMDLDILRMQRSTNPATFSIIVQNGRGGGRVKPMFKKMLYICKGLLA